MRARSSLLRGFFVLLAFALGACTNENVNPMDAGGDRGNAEASTDTSPTSEASVDSGPNPADTDCDPLDEAACALPWPSNLYLRPDPAQRTGFALRFGRTSVPLTEGGRQPDATQFNRFDGYGSGEPIITLIPRLDPAQLAGEDRIDRSMAADAPILLFRVRGTALERVPYFAELDSTATSPLQRVLFVRPAVLLEEGTRYVVAMRNLRLLDGTMAQPSTAFRALRDGTAMSDPRLAPRVARFNEVFGMLQTAGVDRASLYLAWDFNTGSAEAYTGPLLRLRDQMLALQPHGSPMSVVDLTRYARVADSSGLPVNADIALELHGRFTPPNFTQVVPVGTYSGRVLVREASGNPTVNTADPMDSVDFWVRIPWSAVRTTDNPTPMAHGLLQYGHGLLGSGEEVQAGYLGTLANQNRLILFATNLVGFSETEITSVLASVTDPANFRSPAETMQVGLSYWALLARAMRDNFGALLMGDMRTRDLGITLDTTQLYYFGNSQGGIMGTTYLAIAPDISRGVLGVPGNNYSTLLQRSHDFASFNNLLLTTYPSPVDRAVGISFIQLLWNMTDPVSYARHITAQPFAGMQPHHVLFHPARGDLQVAVLTNELLARSNIGIGLMANYDAERMPFGITPTPYGTGYAGSGVVLWHYGNPWPAPGNRVPTATPDPHEFPRRDANAQRQFITFLRTGQITDTCNGMPCGPGRPPG